MSHSLNQLANALNSALTKCEETVKEVEIKTSSYTFGSQLILDALSKFGWPQKISTTNSELISNLFLSNAIVFGKPISINNNSNIPQVVNSSSSVVLYFTTASSLLQEVYQGVVEASRLIGLFFQNQAKPDDILSLVFHNLKFTNIIGAIVAAADLESTFLPEDFQIPPLGEYFSQVRKMVLDFGSVTQEIINTFLENPAQVYNYNQRFTEIYADLSQTLPGFANLFIQFAEAVNDQFTSLYSEEGFSDFQEYLKGIGSILARIVILSTWTAAFTDQAFAPIQTQMVGMVDVFFSIVSKMSSLMRFRGNFEQYAIDVRTAGSQLATHFAPILAELIKVFPLIPQPYQASLQKKVTDAFMLLKDFEPKFNQNLDIILGQIRADRRFILFEAVTTAVKSELAQKAKPYIENTLISAWNLMDAEKSLEVISYGSDIKGLSTQFLKDIEAEISREPSMQRRVKLVQQRSNIERTARDYLESFAVLAQHPDDALLRTNASLDSVRSVLALCSLDNDKLLVDTLEAIRGGLASKNGTFYLEEAMALNGLLGKITKSAADVKDEKDKKLVQSVVGIVKDVIKTDSNVFAADLSEGSPEQVIGCIRANDKLATAMQALATVIPVNTPSLENLKSTVEMYGRCFNQCATNYRLATQIHFEQTCDEMLKVVEPFERISSTANDNRIQELLKKLQESVVDVKMQLASPPPYGIYDQYYLKELMQDITDCLQASIMLIRNAQTVLQRSADPEGVRQAFVDLNGIAQSIIKQKPYVEAVYESPSIQLPALAGILLKDAAEHATKDIEEALNSGTVDVSMVEKLADIATKMDGIDGLQNLAASVRENAGRLNTIVAQKELGGNVDEKEVSDILNEVATLNKQIAPVSVGLVDAVRNANGSASRSSALAKVDAAAIKDIESTMHSIAPVEQPKEKAIKLESSIKIFGDSSERLSISSEDLTKSQELNSPLTQTLSAEKFEEKPKVEIVKRIPLTMDQAAKVGRLVSENAADNVILKELRNMGIDPVTVTLGKSSSLPQAQHNALTAKLQKLSDSAYFVSKERRNLITEEELAECGIEEKVARELSNNMAVPEEVYDVIASTTATIIEMANIDDRLKSLDSKVVGHIKAKLVQHIAQELAAQHRHASLGRGLVLLTSDDLAHLGCTVEQIRAINEQLSKYQPPASQEAQAARDQKMIAELSRAGLGEGQQRLVQYMFSVKDFDYIRKGLEIVQPHERIQLGLNPKEQQLIEAVLKQRPTPNIQEAIPYLTQPQVAWLTTRAAQIQQAEQMIAQYLGAIQSTAIALTQDECSAFEITPSNYNEVSQVVNDVAKTLTAALTSFNIPPANCVELSPSAASALELKLRDPDAAVLKVAKTPAEILAIEKMRLEMPLMEEIDVSTTEKETVAPILESKPIKKEKAKEVKKESVLILDRVPAKKEIEKMRKDVAHCRTAGFLQEYITALDKDAREYEPLLAQYAESPTPELAERMNAMGTRMVSIIETINNIEDIEATSSIKSLSDANRAIKSLRASNAAVEAPKLAVACAKAVSKMTLSDEELAEINKQLAEAAASIDQMQSQATLEVIASAPFKDPALISLEAIDLIRGSMEKHDISQVAFELPKVAVGEKISRLINHDTSSAALTVPAKLQTVFASTKAAPVHVSSDDESIISEFLDTVENLIEEKVAGPSDVDAADVSDVVSELSQEVMVSSTKLVSSLKSKDEASAANNLSKLRSSAIDVATASIIALCKRASDEDVTEDIVGLLKSMTELEQSTAKAGSADASTIRKVGKANRDVTMSLNRLASVCDDLAVAPATIVAAPASDYRVATNKLMEDIARIARIKATAGHEEIAKRKFSKVAKSLEDNLCALKVSVSRVTADTEDSEDLSAVIAELEQSVNILAKPSKATIAETAEAIQKAADVRQRVTQAVTGEVTPHPEFAQKLPFRFTPSTATTVKIETKNLTADAAAALDELCCTLSGRHSEPAQISAALDSFHSALSSAVASGAADTALREKLVIAGDAAIDAARQRLLGASGWRDQIGALRAAAGAALGGFDTAIRAKSSTEQSASSAFEAATEAVASASAKLAEMKAAAEKKRVVYGASYFGADLVAAVAPVLSSSTQFVASAAKAATVSALKAPPAAELTAAVSKLISAVVRATDNDVSAVCEAADAALSLSAAIGAVAADARKANGPPELIKAMAQLADRIAATAENLGALKDAAQRNLESAKAVVAAPEGAPAPRKNRMLEKLNAEARVVEARRKLAAAEDMLKSLSSK